MAKPQFFISSTYYDLKTVRDDISRYLEASGYDTIRHETGGVPYSRHEKLETSCYREIENCDVLVCIIGGRYGASATAGQASITQTELKTAHDLRKQVFIFVDKSVYAEWQFYQSNKAVEGVTYRTVNDRRVFEFIDEVNKLPLGNPLFSFETSSDIVNLLREQLAGLFKRFLNEQVEAEQRRLFEELKGSIATVGELVNFLSEKNTQGNDAIHQILLTDHPIFAALKKLFRVPYRLFFTDLAELNQWLQGARSYRPSEDDWQLHDYIEWSKIEKDKEGNEWRHTLKIKAELFDSNERLKQVSKAAWSENFVDIDKELIDDGDDIPF
jgi:hypothetical protein